MIKLYYHPSPNPAKVALFLEESGLAYEVVPVDTRRGEPFSPEFVAINPNSKTPALTDGDVRVFDSTAILLYLAEKTGQFLSEDTPKARAGLLSWLMFIATGIGPYVLGLTYTIVDMSAWGWARAVPFILGDDAWSAFPHVKRWFDLINARPAAVRANALRDKFTFKSEMDAEARRYMFRHVAAS